MTWLERSPSLDEFVFTFDPGVTNEPLMLQLQADTTVAGPSGRNHREKHAILGVGGGGQPGVGPPAGAPPGAPSPPY